MRTWMAILAASALVACGGEDKGDDTAGGGGGADGGALYDTNCASCHGANGEGGVGVALNAGVAAGMSEADIEAVILNGVPPTMPAFDSLSDDEISAIAGYVKAEFGG